MKQLLAFSLCIVGHVVSQTTDPCDTAVPLNDLLKRQPSYSMDATPLCDFLIRIQWYSVGSHTIPTTAPSLTACGTLYPYWTSDVLPTTHNTMANITVCKVGFASTCTDTHTIRVKKCNPHLVFELTPTTSCNSAYCFEDTTTCIQENVTDVYVAFRDVEWTTINSSPPPIVRYDPDITLICNFTPLNTPNLLYKITWHVDNKEIPMQQVVSAATRGTATLSAKNISNSIEKLNVNIHCTVGAVTQNIDEPCELVASPLFFAGIKIISSLPITMKRGGSTTIQLQLTVPYVSRTVVDRGQIISPVPLYVSVGITKCQSQTVNGNYCSTKFTAYAYQNRTQYQTPANWNGVVDYAIVNKNTAAFSIARSVTLQLTTNGGHGTVGQMFGKLPFPDLPIQIVEDVQSWKGKHCFALTDPHMKTFDNVKYECQLDGKFVLYRNTDSNQEVQVQHKLCHPRHSTPRCICAIAVRAGRQIFTIDLCNGKRYTNFPLCDDKVLRVVREQDKVYKVYLPSGTTVQISIREWPENTDTMQLDVTIWPSAADEGKTSGLCGILDENINNDFTRRNNNKPDPIERYPNGFSNSWLVQSGEDIFDKNMNEYGFLVSMSATHRLLCECDPTTTTFCTYTSGKTCHYERGKELPCFVFGDNNFDRRRKRDVSELNMKEQSEHTHKINRRQTSFPVSREDAETICDGAFIQSTMYLTCLQSVPNFSNTSLENCILDIMMTGDENITKIHIEAALEQCTTLVVLNTTLQEAEPEITYQLTHLCPGNCSGNGHCNDGNCTCASGFAGSDCSFDITGPPTITGTSYNLCDKNKQDCDALYFYGAYFLENMGAKCYVKKTEMNLDGSVRSSDIYTADLQEQTLFMGSCELTNSSGGYWTTDYTMNITVDGERFTEAYNVTVYNSLCQQHHNNNGVVHFTLKSGYCFIQETSSCIAEGTLHSSDYCKVCDPSVDSFNRTYNPACLEETPNSSENTASVTDPSMTPSVTTLTGTVSPITSRTAMSVTTLTSPTPSTTISKTSSTTPLKTTTFTTKQQIIIIASSGGVAFTAVVVAVVIIKNYCLKKTSTAEPGFSEENVQYPDKPDGTNKSSLSINFDSSNEGDMKSMFPSRPPSATSYHSTSIQKLSSTTDLREIYNDGVKASSPENMA